MKTHRKDPGSQLLVLVPHRDARRLLQVYSGGLFSAGCCGAWSFPWVSPLAVLSGPLKPTELKKTASLIREQCPGKISGGPPRQSAFPPGRGMAVFGPALDIDIPDTAFTGVQDRLLYRFSPLVAGAALVQENDSEEFSDCPAPPELFFRAAALANMILRPLSSENYSFRWKIGELYWLPPLKKRGN